MSQLGHYRRFGDIRITSAYPFIASRKADIARDHSAIVSGPCVTCVSSEIDAFFRRCERKFAAMLVLRSKGPQLCSAFLVHLSECVLIPHQGKQ